MILNHVLAQVIFYINVALNYILSLAPIIRWNSVKRQPVE